METPGYAETATVDSIRKKLATSQGSRRCRRALQIARLVAFLAARWTRCTPQTIEIPKHGRRSERHGKT